MEWIYDNIFHEQVLVLIIGYTDRIKVLQFAFNLFINNSKLR